MASGQQGLAVLAQEARLDEASRLAAQLQRHERPVHHPGSFVAVQKDLILAALAPAGKAAGVLDCSPSTLRMRRHAQASRSRSTGRVSTCARSRTSPRGSRRRRSRASAREAVTAARRVVDDAVARGAVVYGVTTGFGSFADVRIPLDRLRELQTNLLRSHAAGVGAPLGVTETRALMLLRANVLARGFSGVRLETLELLVALLNRRVHPLVPSQGSVGASGDLAPLAHLALALIGEGECLYEGRRLPVATRSPPPACGRSCSSPRRAWRSSTARS